ncbi:MAG: hypothetical protein DRP63_09315 [Planctomycetota bacterium]|nr:MAG: hypothetical protein DRP63_09315 [Planctomycetota bacterium]
MRVVVRRGSFIESVHPIKWAVWRKGVVEGCGVRAFHHFRSCAKPFQAAAMLSTNLLQHFPLEPDELAIACASHGGSDVHIATVKKMLARAGLAEDDLLCGTYPPLDHSIRRRLLQQNTPPTPAQHNCSGKHALMLLACVHMGWDIKTYFSSDHPCQMRCKEVIKRITGSRRVGYATDGCGVVEFVLPLWAMAKAYAQLAYPRILSNELTTLRNAIRSNPVHFAYESATPTLLLQITGGRVIMKTGGAGLRCGVDTETGVAFAVKTVSGSVDVPTMGRERRYQLADMAAVAVMCSLDILSSKERRQLQWLLRIGLLNARGEVIGEATVET